MSTDKLVTCGVPQGSILEPLLFLLFINDLPLIMSGIISSVDDTTLYDINKCKYMLESNLNKSLKALEKWCLLNGMQLNTDKTKVMLITTKQKRALTNNSIALTYKNVDLAVSTEEKLLGVNI